MKNIRHIYRFHFHGKGMNTVVEIKAQTLKDALHKINFYESSLQSLADRSWNVSKVEIHTRRSIPVWKCHNYSRGFLAHEVMSKRDFERVVNGK